MNTFNVKTEITLVQFLKKGMCNKTWFKVAGSHGYEGRIVTNRTLSALKQIEIEKSPGYKEISSFNPVLGEAKAHVLNVQDVEFCLAAMADKDIRYYLCGLAVCDGVMVATDGRRLHLAGNGVFDNQKAIIVPRNIIKLAVKLAKIEKAESLTLFTSECGKFASVELSELALIFTLVDGRYPNVNQVIPICKTEKFSYNQKTEKKQFSESLKLVKLVSKFGVVKFWGNNAKTLKDDHAVYNPLAYYLSAFAVEQISFNYQYLFDALNSGINFDFIGIKDKLIFTDSNLKYKAIIMPYRV